MLQQNNHMQKGPKTEEKTKEGTLKMIEAQDNIITIIKSQMSKILIMLGAK